MAHRRSPSTLTHLHGVAVAMVVLAVACTSTAPPGIQSPDVAPTEAESPGAGAGRSAAITARPSTAASEPSPQPVDIPPTWQRLEPGGDAPPAREDGTWTAEPNSRMVYLFGGRDGGVIFDDLWTFDLDTERWTRVNPVGRHPAERFGHEAVWVEGTGLVIFAGQAGPATFFDDLWAFDPAAQRWRQLPAEGARPKARYGTCAGLGPDGRLWISHGFTEDGTRFADTQAYDVAAGRWSDETPAGTAPVNRCLHGCWWTDDGRFALYAGQTTGVEALGDLWSLSGAGTRSATWAEQAGELPKDRNLYASARHAGSMVVVGGRGVGATFLDDAFTIDAVTLEVRPLEPSGEIPAGRGGAMLVDDPLGGRVILFGGKNADGALADLWQLSLD